MSTADTSLTALFAALGAIPERMAALERETAAMRNDVGAWRGTSPAPGLAGRRRALPGGQPPDHAPLDQDGQGTGREGRRNRPRRLVAPSRCGWRRPCSPRAARRQEQRFPWMTHHSSEEPLADSTPEA